MMTSNIVSDNVSLAHITKSTCFTIEIYHVVACENHVSLSQICLLLTPNKPKAKQVLRFILLNIL
jgi:hypothetical protein